MKRKLYYRVHFVRHVFALKPDMKAVWSQLLWTPRTRSKWNLALGYVTMLLFLQLLAFFLFGFCHRNSCMRHKDVAMAMTTAMACPSRLSALLTYVLLAFCGAALRKRMLSCCCQLPGVFIVALLQSQNPPKARGPENPLAHHPPTQQIPNICFMFASLPAWLS